MQLPTTCLRAAALLCFCAASAGEPGVAVPAAPLATQPADLADALLAQHWLFEEDALARPRRVPADDAPEQEFWSYWSKVDARFGTPREQVPDAFRARLLPLALAHPDTIPGLLPLLPDTSAAHDSLKALYDHPPDWLRRDETWKEHVRAWLMYHSRYFRDDLLAAAKAMVHDEFDMMNVQGAQEALAGLDWPAAETLLKSQAGSNSARVAASALVLLYRHAAAAHDEAAAAPLRERLQRIGADGNAPGFARSVALDALAATPWAGRAGWFTGRLEDRTLDRLEDDHASFSNPLLAWASAAPGEALPVACKAADAAATRPTAAAMLLAIGTPDALRPLLPALTAPASWPHAVPRDLARALQEVELPGSVEPLVAWSRSADADPVGAALALARQRAKEGPAALKAALENGHTDIATRKRLLEALLDLHAYTPAEVADAVEAGESEAVHSDPLAAPSTRWAIAAQLLELVTKRPGVAEALLARSAAVRSSDPALADGLWADLAGFSSPAVDRECIRRLEGDPLGLPLATLALRRAATLRVVDGDGLRALAGGTGSRAGLAAAVLADPAVIAATLAGTDVPAKRTLLAAATVAGIDLPLPALKGAYQDAAAAPLVERALLHIDSPDARALVRSNHPGELLILGKDSRYPANPPADASFATPADKHLPRLIKELAGPHAPEEIVALFSSGGFGEDGQRIVRLYKDHATLERAGYDGTAAAAEPVALDAVRALAAFLQDQHIDDLPSLANHQVFDGVWYDYFHLTPTAGRHIYINNPKVAAGMGTWFPVLVGRIKNLDAEVAGEGAARRPR